MRACASKLYVSKLCVGKLCVGKLCVGKLRVGKLCVSKRRDVRDRRRDGGSAQPTTKNPTQRCGEINRYINLNKQSKKG